MSNSDGVNSTSQEQQLAAVNALSDEVFQVLLKHDPEFNVLWNSLASIVAGNLVMYFADRPEVLPDFLTKFTDTVKEKTAMKLLQYVSKQLEAMAEASNAVTH